MKIAIIAEGCYPYVTGGVSSWVHNLMKEMPQHHFDVLAITADDQPRAVRYDRLPNLGQIIRYPLTASNARRTAVRLSAADRALIADWLKMTQVVPGALGLLADADRLGDADSFLASQTFYQLMAEQYEKAGESCPFLAYYWSWRNMLTPLLRLLQQPVGDYDLLQVTATGYAGVLAAALHEQTGVKVVLTEHGIYAREREEDILQSDWLDPAFKHQWVRFFRYLAKQAYAAADSVVTLSAANQAHQKSGGADAAKLRLVPNGVRVAQLATLKRHQFDPKAGLQIGAIIRMVPIKDITTLIQACGRLAEQGVPFACYLMGSTDENPEYAAECRAMIAALGLSAQVHMTGQINVMDYLPRLDVLVLSSISEGQPLAVLEGMAAGLPWVCTDVGACRELLYGNNDSFGQAGFVVRPVAPRRIADHLAWFYQHPDMMQKMGQNGARRARRYYQLDAVADTYDHLYKLKGAQGDGGR
ncbi:GT4 family glycosyltransferase PelF [Lacticaseibacillus camelliae]|uniref:Glycosyltransferase n=2 Tax=Lacticaseibacillus camelliae TaxID=381742 RepID=A0A0R2FF06_9LACO|nr:GT4 family glycosyltransferase PelF [Lacticaseibacillus camelliae]KRN23799.1 hypothetical protein FC75_GL001378 [Lacticaseibacillus camelliae DSM 22697 = JCM 13995]